MTFDTLDSNLYASVEQGDFNTFEKIIDEYENKNLSKTLLDQAILKCCKFAKVSGQYEDIAR